MNLESEFDIEDCDIQDVMSGKFSAFLIHPNKVKIFLPAVLSTCYIMKLNKLFSQEE